MTINERNKTTAPIDTNAECIGKSHRWMGNTCSHENEEKKNQNFHHELQVTYQTERRLRKTQHTP